MAKIDWTDKKQRALYQRNKYQNDHEYRKKHLKNKSIRDRERYANDPEHRKKVLEINKKGREKRYITNQTKAFRLIGVFGCSNKDCKEEDVEYCHQIDWHHQKPEKKTGRMAHMFRNYTWERVKKEIVDADVIPLAMT